jgi:hypothetical protein
MLSIKHWLSKKMRKAVNQNHGDSRNISFLLNSPLFSTGWIYTDIRPTGLFPVSESINLWSAGVLKGR